MGRQLEEYAARNSEQPVEATALAQAVQSFIAEGDIESQMRVMRKALARNALSGVFLDRYLVLLASRQPEELLAVVRGNGSAEIRNRAVQYAIAGFRHLHERSNYDRVMTALDFTAPGGNVEFGQVDRADGAPPFFSGNVGSLSRVLSRVAEIRVTGEEQGIAMLQTVVYQLAQ